LHAKLVFAEHDRGYTLWLGSANATHRGWVGPNTEVVARLHVDDTVKKGLWAFLETARPVTLAELPVPPKKDDIEERLDAARKEVVNQWAVRQIRQSGGVTLVSDHIPHPHDQEILMNVGVITGPCIPWPRDTIWLELPEIPKAKETDLVLVRLSLKDVYASWVQLAPLDPPSDEDRDHRALAAHLSPRVFLLWLRSMLGSGEMLDGGGDWRSSNSGKKSKDVNIFTWGAPTLEEVLSTWTRAPQNIKMVDQKVQTYLVLIREEYQVEFSDEEKKLLQDFEETWQVIRAAFLAGNI
jgi:hypothetical protein